MIVLADNDIIYKLSCCQLLPEFLTWLKSPPADIYVLSELPFVVRRRLKNNPQALTAFELFLAKVKPLPEVQFDTLASLSRFDVGEQMLLAVLCENKHVQRFVTGDKRALRLMAETLPQHQLLAKRLNDIRTDCFESALLGLAESIGFDALSDKVLLGLDSDKVLGMTFGTYRDEAHMHASLGSYIEDIQRYAPFVSL
jgi:hypothetical protein